eukprot:XP_025014465.1 probable polygalacturonase At1g80170 [Ricinus communis]
MHHFSIFIGSARSSVLNVVDFGATGDGQTDDSMAFLQAWKVLCGAAPAQNVPILMVPAGKTFLLQPVEFSGPCSSSAVSVQVLGNIVAPRSIDAWKFGQSESWLSFSHVLNLTIFGTGQIDGQGSAWWSHSHPRLKTTAVSISDVTYSDVRGTSAQKEAIRLDCSEIGCTNVVMTGIYITPSGTSVHQTDAYCQNVKGTFNNVTPDVNCLSGSS